MPPRRAPAGASYAPARQGYNHPHALTDPDESAVRRFIREEVTAPEKLAGNISILTAVSMFVGGIVAIRVWGDIIIPA